jgi:hypothetical protein
LIAVSTSSSNTTSVLWRVGSFRNLTFTTTNLLGIFIQLKHVGIEDNRRQGEQKNGGAWIMRMQTSIISHETDSEKAPFPKLVCLQVRISQGPW